MRARLDRNGTLERWLTRTPVRAQRSSACWEALRLPRRLSSGSATSTLMRPGILCSKASGHVGCAIYRCSVHVVEVLVLLITLTNVGDLGKRKNHRPWRRRRRATCAIEPTRATTSEDPLVNTNEGRCCHGLDPSHTPTPPPNTVSWATHLAMTPIAAYPAAYPSCAQATAPRCHGCAAITSAAHTLHIERGGVLPSTTIRPRSSYRVVLVTYASGQPFESAQQRLAASAEAAGVDEVISWSRPLLNATPWGREHLATLNKKKEPGCATCSWKPFIILDALKRVRDGDVILCVAATVGPTARHHCTFRVLCTVPTLMLTA